jgi:glycosyltransferase involved in cell wall biosynthesis
MSDDQIQTAKVDFHLHSHASNVTDYYAANAFSIPESYSDPIKLHALLKQRGMSLITLTDHNSIDGVLAMLDAGLPDVFISAEMTTTFPEDGCNIHITIANVTEWQFREANRLRGNVYEMVSYLDKQIEMEQYRIGSNKLAYFMTHPLMSTQNRPYGREGALKVEHLEKALLLCNCIEVQNGARTTALNQLTREWVESLTPEAIARLEDKHRFRAKGPTPWLKSIVAGSDDHSGINPGRTWTSFQFSPAGDGRSPTPNDLIDAIRARRTQNEGAHGGPITIAHSVLKLLYEGSTQKASQHQRSMSVGGPILSLLNLVFDENPLGPIARAQLKAKTWYYGVWRTGRSSQLALNRRRRSLVFDDVLQSEIYKLLASESFRSQLTNASGTDERIFFVVKSLLHQVFSLYLTRLRSSGKVNLVEAIKEFVALYSSNLFVSLPYLMAFLQQGNDSQIARDVRRSFKLREPQKVALLTDTFFDVNGVSATIKRMIRESIRRDTPFTVFTCVDPSEIEKRCANPEIKAFIEAGRLHILPAVETMDFPEYDGLKLHFPPVLDILRLLQEGGFTKVQLSTPGAMGLTGLLASKLLQIDSAATYHTSFPEYVENYTKDVSLEALAWKLVILFYQSVDEVLVPSKFIADLLHERGLRNRKLLVLDRWVDVERFSSTKRRDDFWDQYGIRDAQNLTKFIYVGRLAQEKNLQLMASAFRDLCVANASIHLIVVGDGPYRDQLAAQLSGLPVTFTGYLHGDDLAVAIASADVKLFPSTTDTWGNAPLEAQACGLPVVVSDVGGQVELMQDQVTGFVTRANDVESFRAAMERLLDGALRRRMSEAARQFAVQNRVDEPFKAIFDSAKLRKEMKKREKALKVISQTPNEPTNDAKVIGHIEPASHEPLVEAPSRVAYAVG